MNFNGKVVTAFGLASAILLGVCVLSYRDMLRTASDEKWVAHTHFVREELEELLSDLDEAQARVRRYILTREKVDSASLEETLVSVRKHTENVRELTADHATQQTSLAELNPLVAMRVPQMHEKPPQAVAR